MSPANNVLERIIAKFRIGRAVVLLCTERKQWGVKPKHTFAPKS